MLDLARRQPGSVILDGGALVAEENVFARLFAGVDTLLQRLHLCILDRKQAIVIGQRVFQRSFVAEQSGEIYIIGRDGKLRDGLFLDLRDAMVPLLQAFDERGLLGLAFHPEFAENGLFYINYPGGTGLTSGAVFGRISGASAAEFAAVRSAGGRAAE